MRTIHWSQVLCTLLWIGSLTLLPATPLRAVERASSVNFIDRDAIAMGGATGARGNPLRSGAGGGAENDASNSLRYRSEAMRTADAAVARGYGEPSPPASRGLQLRPRTTPTGIFSGWLGETAKPQPRAATAPAQSQFRSKPMPPKTAARRAMSLLPQFLSSSAKKQEQETSASFTTPTRSRTGSAMEHAAPVPLQDPVDRATMQASYTTAASAQSYQHRGVTNQAPPAQRGSIAFSQKGPPSRLNPNPGPMKRATSPRVTRSTGTRPAASMTGGQASSTVAQSLAEAHKLSESARTEADYSKIFVLCQQIPASKATDEETRFGRQLAAWSLNRRGQLRAKAGNDQEALADFNLAIRVDPKCWRALHNRGVTLAQSGQFEPAFDDFHRTIEINPEFAKAHSNRAALYVLAGELEPALADYQRAIELDANLAVAHRGCGRTCHLMGRTDEALEHLTMAIELAPKDSAALASRGDLLTDIGEYAAAANDYERALSANAKSADACRGSAWLLATCPDEAVRDPEFALQRAQMAMDLARKPDAVTLDTLAAAQAGVGDFEAATQTIRQAIELAPPSERSVYQDRLQMYRRSTPLRIAPLEGVQQAGYQQ